MKKIIQAILVLAICAAGGAVAAYAGGNPHGDKVTICHAAGQAGTTHYVTLTIGHQAVYGPAGHFYENGTPQAGHEQDYLGACGGDETTPEECGDGQYQEECVPTTPTETTPTTPTPPPPPPRLCPDGLPPTPGEGAYDPNDDCKRPPPPVVTTTPPPPVVTTPPAVTPPVVTPPATTPPKASPPKATPEKPKAKPKQKTVKVVTKPKLTGDPKKDECVPKNGLLVCKVGTKTITVVPGQG